jgi:CRP-like cAMP-binding protein
MILSTVFVQALFAGLFSAVSMPLGAITSFFWHPSKRIIAFLMAFGGGALLAALFLDLVNEAKEKGHILELVVGTILGSVLFTLMDKVVNNSGGFLRKPSTTLVHLSQQESKHLAQRIDQLQRITLFQHLEPETYKALAAAMLMASFDEETLIYRAGDPSETLYFINQGGVTLTFPKQADQRVIALASNDTFGRLAFITGCPHNSTALVTQSTRLGMLSRSDFELLLKGSHRLLENTAHYLQSEDIADYLQQRGLTKSEIEQWVFSALQSLRQRGMIPPAINKSDRQEEFLARINQIRRLPIFSRLSLDERQDFADRLIFKDAEDGFILFQPQDPPDRLFILASGEVEIIYPVALHKPPLILHADDMIGELSFVTGTKHTVTAIAKTDITYWVIRRQYFQELLQKSEQLRQNLADFLKQNKLQDYLKKAHHVESAKVTDWTKKALTQMNAQHLIPSAAVIADEFKEKGSAPMAIWLGLMMDGIPEALTIGAHLVVAPLSPSLLAGLFIANYPEAFSSSEGMQQQGFATLRILTMWTSIMIVTGLLAALGTIIFASVSANVVSLLGSIAAGAMLTVISETMLPEAYAKGGSVVGISTILGFLAIVLIQSVGSVSVH